MASGDETKYRINGFLYLGKDGTRESSTHPSELLVPKLMKRYTMKDETITTDNILASLRNKIPTLVRTIH